MAVDCIKDIFYFFVRTA